MKRFALLASALLMCLAYGCNEVPEPEVKAPTVLLEKGDAGVTSLSFKAVTTEATKATYVVVKDGEALPALAEILSSGTEMVLDENGVAEVTAEGLEENTKYQVVAAVANSAKSAGSNTLYMTTLKAGEVAVSVEVVHVGHENMSFRVNATNATKVVYLVLPASVATPEANSVLLLGTAVDLESREAVEVKDLACATDYKLLVVAEGVGATVMADPVAFTTEDDPANVLKHNYTRARGSKWNSNYFVMLSYEDANEADNFAYNEKTLSLDFYGDPDKNYLPAGTYTVKASNEAPCVSTYYSTYGYDNGVGLSSGEVVVEIDPETKAYTINADLYLKDGRHMQAHYNGNLDGMKVVDIVTVKSAFTKASASTTNGGENWMVVLKDAEGNEAHLDVYNSRKAPYLVDNSYTISTSTESEDGTAANPELEAGEFNAATSYFVLASGESMPFATGSFHVQADWANKTYNLSLYATLGENYIIECDYRGAVEGIGLELSEEVISVELNSAYARGYEGNSNWYLTFAQTIDEVQNYYLALDVYCPPTPYLLAGVYQLGVGTGEGYLNPEVTKLTVRGETTYELIEARATVDIDAATKTYRFNISARVADGRTFAMSYTGAVEGMEILDAEDNGESIVWSKYTLKHWYSDNWELKVVSEDGANTLVFDLRTGDSSLNHLAAGTYVGGYDGMYVDLYYSMFNSAKNSFKEVTLVVDYDEATTNYTLSFEAHHNDGRIFTGNYTGAVGNH